MRTLTRANSLEYHISKENGNNWIQNSEKAVSLMSDV